MLNLQQNAQLNPPIQSPPTTFQLTTTLLKVMVQVSIVTIQV